MSQAAFLRSQRRLIKIKFLPKKIYGRVITTLLGVLTVQIRLNMAEKKRLLAGC